MDQKVKLPKSGAVKAITEVSSQIRIRHCRMCKVQLPQTNYFHCNPCKDKIEAQDGSEETFNLPPEVQE